MYSGMSAKNTYIKKHNKNDSHDGDSFYLILMNLC